MPDTEHLKEHIDWLQDRADNPSTVMPGSTEPRSIVDSKKLGEIARDIREFAEDVEDEAKLETSYGVSPAAVLERLNAVATINKGFGHRTLEQERIASLERAIFDEINLAAAGHEFTDLRYVAVPEETGNARVECERHIVIKGYALGREHPEGMMSPMGVQSPREAKDETLYGILPLVKGKHIYWRQKPEMWGMVYARIKYPGESLTIQQPDGWITYMRLGIDA